MNFHKTILEISTFAHSDWDADLIKYPGIKLARFALKKKIDEIIRVKF
jgi:hypothetical protein